MQGQRYTDMRTITRSGGASVQVISEHTSANSQARAGWGENRGVAAIENGPAKCSLRGVRVRWQYHQGKRPGVWGGIARSRSTLGELRSTQDRKKRQHADRQVLPRVNRLRSALLRGQHTREVFNAGENLARGRR